MTDSHDRELEKLEVLARQLEQSADFRVLRKIKPRLHFSRPEGKLRTGVILDLETTGLDVANDELIELAILKFQFSFEDRIVEVADQYSCFNEPTNGIPEEISSLTGITATDVAGKLIASQEVEKFLSDVSLVIAHNAQFDRPLFERYVPHLGAMSWACSATEIDWRAEGFGGARLEHLLAAYGYFYDSHRALSDCHALLQLLAFDLPKAQQSAFKVLLQSARQSTIRIFADGAPFESKDLLKRRGYRWSDGSILPYKAWWKDFSSEEYHAEIHFLRANVFKDNREIPSIRMSARNRFKAAGA